MIALKNGDRITGSIIKKDGKTVTIRTEAFGVISALWDQVASVATDAPVTVELQSGDVLNGTVQTRDDKIVVQTPAALREAPLAEVTAVRDGAEQRAHERLLNPPWDRLWSGSANVGFAGTQGNAETLTMTLGLNAARATRKDKTTVRLNAIQASALVNADNDITAKAVRGGVAYERNLSSRLFVNTFNEYEYDRFQNLDLRVVLGGGAGYKLRTAERSRLDLTGGGAYNRESFSANPAGDSFTRQSGEAYFGNEFSLRVGVATSLYQSSRFFANLTNTGEYRVNFDLGAATKLTRWLTWNTSLSDRFLSNPVPGRQKNDLLYSTGIGLTFSR